jgi:CelD/BcsL family acetyltransferase involved in cellulose biosynthesis
MEIDLIDDLYSFDNLKANWEEVYYNDKYATIFQSWSWLRGWIETVTNPWLIICVRPKFSSSYVGFFPLIFQFQKRNRGRKVKILTFWGNPSAEHTGIVCTTEFFESIFNKVSQFIQKKIKWDMIQISNALDPRIENLIDFFNNKRFVIKELNPTACPYIVLPDSLERYYMENLTSKSRRNIRKAMKNTLGQKEFKMTTLENNDFNSQVRVVRELWIRKWGEPKHDQNKFLNVYKRCFDDNRLLVTVFWNDIEPIAGLTAFADHLKKSFVAYSMSFDQNYSNLSPGTAILAYSIDYAIQNGFLEYDFGRGDEGYKFSTFGAENRFNKNYIIERVNIGTKLIPQIKKVKDPIKNFKGREYAKF